MNAYGRMWAQFHLFLTSAPNGVKSASPSSCFKPVERAPLFTKQQAEWAPEPIGHSGEEKNLLSSARNQTMTSQMSSPWLIQYTNYAIPVPYVIM